MQCKIGDCSRTRSWGNGANTCLMPGGDGLPEGAMFSNEDGKRFLQIVTKPIAKSWKFDPKCMRNQLWCEMELPRRAILRSICENNYFLTSTGRKRPPKSGDFEAGLGMETWSCTRYWQKSFFENVLPTEGGEHISLTFAKSGSMFHKIMHNSMRKDEKVI